MDHGGRPDATMGPPARSWVMPSMPHRGQRRGETQERARSNASIKNAVDPVLNWFLSPNTPIAFTSSTPLHPSQHS
ncbi:hypothetical protein SAMD00023353_6300480 [Rosellinia necatrix]|uniref:Uncharacterized protein n=1 Tax=Rosellinia necatrix TaxID=77044 RepID=A0A1S8AAI1_ROSNE|nr:hypothetical protein SAMD00023353_6300480 [Rosellinia necatrix]